MTLALAILLGIFVIAALVLGSELSRAKKLLTQRIKEQKIQRQLAMRPEEQRQMGNNQFNLNFI